MKELLKTIKIIETFKRLGLNEKHVASIIIESNIENLLFANDFAESLGADFVVIESDGSATIKSFYTKNLTTIKSIKKESDSAIPENDKIAVSMVTKDFLCNIFEKSKNPTILYINKLDEFSEMTDWFITGFLQSCRKNNTWVFISLNKEKERYIHPMLFDRSFIA